MSQTLTRRKMCPLGYIAHLRTCGHHQATPIACKSILCKECERKRAQDAQERWYPTLAKYPHLSMMTLTIKGDTNLHNQLTALDKAFRSLLDYRLGKNNRAKIQRLVDTRLAELEKQGKDKPQLEQWRRACQKWLELCAQKETKEGKSFKFRKMMEGLSNLEATYNQDCDLWHSHRHLIVSMPFMPEIVLSVLWNECTQNNGYIVDIRTVKNLKEGLKETIKYCAKFWEIPEPKQDELLQAMRNKKRLWVIGRIKPTEPDPKPCSECGKTDCTCNKIFILQNGTNEAILNNSLYIATLPTGQPVTVTISKDSKGRTTWEARYVTADDLSLYRATYQVNVDEPYTPQTHEAILASLPPLPSKKPPSEGKKVSQQVKIENYNPQLQMWE